MEGVAVVRGTIGGGVISHYSVNDLFNDTDHLFKTHGTSFTFESAFENVLQGPWALLQYTFADQLLSEFRLESPESFSLGIKPLVEFCIL